MNYLICFAFYSICGWVLESAVASVRERRVVNVGLLNGPVYFLPGFIVMVGAIFLEPHINPLWILMIGMCVVSAVCEYVFAGVCDQYFHVRMWNYSSLHLNLRGYTCFLSSVLRGVPIALVLKYLHPQVVHIVTGLPTLLRAAACIVFAVVIALDTVLSVAGLYQTVRVQISKTYERVKHSPGVRWYQHHILRSRAKVSVSDDGESFAHGYNRYKLFWIFVIGSLIGDIVETLYILATKHVLMSRSSLIYGPFSVVWGMGAVLFTILLRSWSNKSDRYIFIGGLMVGGVYEYVCSMLTERFYGMVFWDYSKIPFNINGRINLLFCCFWGVFALFWVKEIYPRLSALIELIPSRIGRPITWVLAVFLAVSSILSVAALMRMDGRRMERPADNAVEVFLDTAYPDDFLYDRYQNIIKK